MAIVVLLAGKIFWPTIMPLSWTAVLVYSLICPTRPRRHRHQPATSAMRSATSRGVR
jgi:hypothetical protein